MSDFALVPYDGENEEHRRFLWENFCESIRSCWPWSGLRSAELRYDLEREMAQPGTVSRMIASNEDPDDFLGWLVVRPERREVVFAFVRYRARRMGVLTDALSELGITKAGGPIPVLYWTRASHRMAKAHGWPLYFNVGRDVENQEREAASQGVPASAGHRNGRRDGRSDTRRGHP